VNSRRRVRRRQQADRRDHRTGWRPSGPADDLGRRSAEYPASTRAGSRRCRP